MVKNICLSVHVAPYLHEKLNKISKKTRIPKSQIIKAALEIILDRFDNDKPVWDEDGEVIL